MKARVDRKAPAKPAQPQSGGPQAASTGQAPGASNLERLSDLDVYRLLLRLSERTGELAARCWSRAAATTLAAAARVLRALASALYRANLDQ